jgi:cardiolipin synthase
MNHVGVATVISAASHHRPTAVDRLFMAAFGAARRELNITTAYFVPSTAISASLIAAAKRGVKVRILTNGPHTNHKVTRWAGRATYQLLLEAGIAVYEYDPVVLHAKVITADGVWSTIGSANVDARSLVLNDELNIATISTSVATLLNRQFELDLTHATAIRPESWAHRSWSSRALETYGSLWRSQV